MLPKVERRNYDPVAVEAVVAAAREVGGVHVGLVVVRPRRSLLLHVETYLTGNAMLEVNGRREDAGVDIGVGAEEELAGPCRGGEAEDTAEELPDGGRGAVEPLVGGRPHGVEVHVL